MPNTNIEIPNVYVPCAAFLKAMAHPARVRLLYLLRKQTMNVTELASQLGSSISQASRHLKAMADAGILVARDAGREKHYFVDHPCAICLMERLGASPFYESPAIPLPPARRPM